MCMAHINYPAKVLFKSANPIVTMIFGLCWFGKKYAFRDYIVVLLLVLGLYFFMNGTSKEDSPKGTRYGIFLVTMSLFGSAGLFTTFQHEHPSLSLPISLSISLFFSLSLSLTHSLSLLNSFFVSP